MNPFTDLTDLQLTELSIEWLAHRHERAEDIRGWAEDCAALKAERDRRRGNG